MGNSSFSRLSDIQYSVFSIWPKWLLAYSILLFSKRKRMYKYNLTLDAQPTKAGFIIPELEWKLECLSNDLFCSKGGDELFCFGINSSGDCLAVQIAREYGCSVASSLYLRYSGSVFILPKDEILQVEDNKMFGNARFFIRCLAPFRKWRIFFNGMLRIISLDEKIDDIVHVTFSFIWTASSGVFDFWENYSTTSMADILSKMLWRSVKPPVKKLLDILNEYHQAGMLLGTISINGEKEHEIYLWGCRKHSMGSSNLHLEHYLNLFGNAKNGCFFFFKMLSAKNISKKIVCGYVMQPNGVINAVRFLSVVRFSRHKKPALTFKVKGGNCCYKVNVFISGYGYPFEKGARGNSSIGVVDVLVNGIWGHGIAIEGHGVKSSLYKVQCKEISLHSISAYPDCMPFVVKFDDPFCLLEKLSGTEGSSLAKLTQWKDGQKNFEIPQGIVVTTSAYEEFIWGTKQSILILEENMNKYTPKELKPLCKRVVEEISNSYFPEEIYFNMCSKLSMVLKDTKALKFTVKPSIIGHEPELLHLQSQLPVYLSVVGFPEVIRSIKKCWASQFSYSAIKSKRATGLPINAPMAVIIQTENDFEVCGSVVTCESTTGNPSFMEIRVEESIKVDIEDAVHVILLKRSLHDCIKVKGCTIIRENETKIKDKILRKYLEQFEDDIECLSNETAILLGKTAIKLENIFRWPLHFKWSCNKNKISILQVQHIAVFNTETASEVGHFFDSSLRTEDEWIASFSAGKAMVGAISPLGADLLNQCVEIAIAQQKCVTLYEQNLLHVPYFSERIVKYCNHCMYNVVNELHFHGKNSDCNLMKSLTAVKFCEIIDSPEFYHMAKERQVNPNLSVWAVLHSLMALSFSGFKSRLLKWKSLDYSMNLQACENASSVFKLLLYHYQDISEPLGCYLDLTFASTAWSMIIMHILAKSRKIERGGNKAIFQDFNALMSAFNRSEKDDIPVALQNLALNISKCIEPEVFREMTVEEAKYWLENSLKGLEVNFSCFLQKYGHRCLKETDLYQKCWRMDSNLLIKILQGLVGLIVQASDDAVPHSFSSILPQISVRLNFCDRLILKYALHHYIICIKEKEEAKSCMIKVLSAWREAFHQLADMAVKECYLPHPDCLFFLSISEIHSLLETRTRGLATLAMKRWKAHFNLSKYLFPGLIIGIPKPIQENVHTMRRLNYEMTLDGIPASRGTAIGIAIVAATYNDVKLITKGSILITHYADFTWSCYFPILGGFATDYGGLISDGVVAARKFGLPCVIHLKTASQVINTGDYVFLDGNKGFLRKVSEM